MMKRTWSVIVALVAALALPAIALAAGNWQVTYNSAGKLVENFDTTDVREGMQPGDTETFTVNLSHENSEDGRWYMSNEVLQTLEGTRDNGSAYTYILTFNGPSGSTELFNSDKVGGNQRPGLEDATSGLDEWFYLDTFSKGQTGTIELSVTMDGDTEANEYFDTEALVNMKFAVETDPEPENTERVVERRVPRDRVVQTGEENRLMPFYVAMVVSGALFVALAAYGIVQRKKEQKEGAR